MTALLTSALLPEVGVCLGAELRSDRAQRAFAAAGEVVRVKAYGLWPQGVEVRVERGDGQWIVATLAQLDGSEVVDLPGRGTIAAATAEAER